MCSKKSPKSMTEKTKGKTRPKKTCNAKTCLTIKTCYTTKKTY